MANEEMTQALLRLFSVATGMELKSLPAGIVERWSAEESTGCYEIGVPGRELRVAMALVVGAGRFLATAKDDLDLRIVAELLGEALREVELT